jgi:hypothetical protein
MTIFGLLGGGLTLLALRSRQYRRLEAGYAAHAEARAAGEPALTPD